MGTTLDNLIAKKNELMAEMREKGADALKEAFKEFFEQNPECVALRWRQYTPYFNDGDTCTFGVNDFAIKMTDSEEDAGDYEDGFEDTFAYGDEKARKESEPFKSAAKGANALQCIDDELYQLAFGDHSEVTATRDGFEVEDYGDHD